MGMKSVAVAAGGVAMPSMRLPTPFPLSKNGFFIPNPKPSLFQILPFLPRKTCSSSSSPFPANRLPPSNHLPFLATSCAPSSSFFPFQTVAPGDMDSGSEFYQLIQAHKAATARLPPIEEVRTVLDQSVRGMISTFSQRHEGYPSGSVVDFACDPDGSPILAISSLAVHTKDLSANPKCSLLVARDFEDRTDLVIVVHGDAVSVSENDRQAVRAAYLKRHPDALWVDFGDFQFMRIEPKVVRYVSGVATALLGSGEFEWEEFKAAKVDPIAQFSVPVASHMNRDHADDTIAIVQHSASVKVDSAYMLDLDSLGFNVKGCEDAHSGNASSCEGLKFLNTAEQ